MIILTDKARQKIKNSLLNTNYLGIRVEIRGAGCSGFTYFMDFCKVEGPFDIIEDFDDFKIYIDDRSLIYLSGTEIDYEEDLLKQGFTFNNPNALSCCGCGMSFAVDYDRKEL